jgi:type IV pilus assembly protein PilQ
MGFICKHSWQFIMRWLFNLFLTVFLIFPSPCYARLLLEQHETMAAKKMPLTLSSQILIKAHIVNVDHNYTHELGLSLSTSSGLLKSPGGFTLNLPAAQSDSDTFSFPIAALTQSSILNATLTALEKSGHAQLISDPQIVTLNKFPAIIEAGQEVPYQQSEENGGTSIAFKKAVLRLQVTPEIQPGKIILLHLVINQDQVSDLNINGSPAINTQLLKTQVLMKNKETLILGGVLQENKTTQRQGIPILDRIPMIGWLFRYHKQSDDRKQLLIFVTPTIL